MRDFEEAIALLDYLQQNDRLIPDKDLYAVDDGQLYASALSNLAQPLPDGTPSPFSSQSPTAGHALLISQIIYLQSLLGHRVNAKLTLEFIRQLRMLGIELAPAQFPVIELLFRGESGALIPVNTEVRSNVNRKIVAYTTSPVTIGSSGVATVSARLNQLGSTPLLRPGEMSDMPRSLSRVASVVNTGTIVSEGREKETLQEGVLRARQYLQTGRRCVTPRDFIYWAKQFGAEAVNVMRGTPNASMGYFADLITIAVYPQAQVSIVKDSLIAMLQDGSNFDGTLADERIDVIPAEIIPLTGRIGVGADPHLSPTTLYNLTVNAIQTYINPPAGIWGDRAFLRNLATAIEKEEGIYSVPSLDLYHAETGVAVGDMTSLMPYHLFEIQAGTSVFSAV